MFVMQDLNAAMSSGRASSFGSRSISSSSSSSSARSSSVRSTPISSSSSSSSGRSSFFGSTKTTSPVASVKNETLFAKFKAQNTVRPTSTPTSVDTIFNRSYRTSRRAAYYSGYTPSPVYQTVIHQHPNYGIFDSMLMWSMLDNMSDRQMYYHHQSEPAFQQWRTDADKLCKDGNKDICAKLADLDKDVNQLKTQGVAQNRTYVTPDIDPNIYTTDAVNVKDIGEIKICTGTATSDYSRFASSIGETTKLKINYVITDGSMDNLDKLSKGFCDIAFAQSDTIANPELVPLLSLDTREAGLLLCNKDGNIKKSSDLTDNTKIYIGSDQTGSQYTFGKLKLKGMVSKDSKVIIAANAIESEKDSCLFAVDTWDAPFIKQLDTSNKVQLVPIADVAGYQSVIVQKDHYINLTQKEFTGWGWIGTETIAVTPTLITTKQWADANQVVVYDILMLNKKSLERSVR